ncbi:MAG TPA: hypothetical protein DCL44_09490 [Elusimicrobia bacterium]|nr:hypothetical protein [Elusimicrobiota bacterium]
MPSGKQYIFITIGVIVAGIAYTKNPGINTSADLRDAVADNREFPTGLPVFDQNSGNIPEPKAEVVEGVSKDYVAGNEPSAGALAKPVEWVTINGGKFMMGTDSSQMGLEDAKPVHEVAIRTFDISKTAVTVEQYEECVLKGGCTEPGTGRDCNWGLTGRRLHPVNCVDWNQAVQYAKFKGARLPSESEWEYAAKSGGKNQKYPWGSEEAACDKAVMANKDGHGCGKKSTMPVCSKQAGNTEQDLCDMAGNVWQWVQDKYQDSYKGASDGSAFEDSGSRRVMRGGSFSYYPTVGLRADFRSNDKPNKRSNDVGFRLAR